MVLDKVFNIVSHFKFEIGSGLVTLSKLEDKLGAVSKASQDVSNQFKFLFTRSALSLTGATGGIAGVLQKAIKSSEDFSKSQQKLAQVLSGNKKHFKNPMKDFNESMVISKSILTGMVGEANKLGVGVNAYMDTFNHFNTLLVPKGAAGDNLEMSKKLALNMMRGSNVLGMHESDVMWQGGSLIEGQANSNQTLFRRLKTETEAFKGVSPSQFNAKKPKERVEMLVKGLGQFTDSSQLLETHLKSLTGQMTILSNLFDSAGSILKPFGDIFRKLFVEGLTHLNKFLEDKMSKVIKMLANDFNSLFGNLEDVGRSILKLNTLSADFKRSRGIATLVFAFVEMRRLLPAVSRGIFKLAKVLGFSLGASIGFLVKRLGGLGKGLKIVGFIFGFLLRSAMSYLKIGLPILLFIRTLDRAKSSAQKLDVINLAENIDRYAAKSLQLKNIYIKIIQPLDYMMTYLSKFFVILFSVSKQVQLLFAGLEKIGLVDSNYLNEDGMKKSSNSLNMYAMAIVKTFAVIETTFKYFLEFALLIFKNKFKPIVDKFRFLVFHIKLLGGALSKVASYFKEVYDSVAKFFGGGKKEPKTGLKEVVQASDGRVLDVYKKSSKDEGNFFTKIIDRYLGNIDKHTTAYKKRYEKIENSEKARNIINVAKVEIKNQFRENLQPDRVAIAIKDVLTQAVQAPTGTNSRDNTYIGGVGGGFVGG